MNWESTPAKAQVTGYEGQPGLTKNLFKNNNQSNIILVKKIKKTLMNSWPVFYPKFLIKSGRVNHSSIFFLNQTDPGWNLLDQSKFYNQSYYNIVNFNTQSKLKWKK